MPIKNEEKKRIEAFVLSAARNAGVPIPTGEIPGEQPDFRIETETGTLGIEVTELLRPASGNGGIAPVEEESFHREIVQIAQQEYYSTRGAKSARVVVYFANARGKKRNKQGMARSLAEFVKENIYRANPVIPLSGVEVPEGFGSMSIASESGDWWCGGFGCFTISDIHEQLAARIRVKNKLLSTYRANLPKAAYVWLILYTGVTVSRSMSIPHGIEEWRFPFDFERVFWCATLENEVAEIQRVESAKRVAV
jgi:hypothetical protein